MKSSDRPEAAPWKPLSPLQVQNLMADVGGRRWWIAGGHALDLFLQRPTRHHDDIDVSILRPDQLLVHDALPGWDIRAADPPGTLRVWSAGEELPPDVHDGATVGAGRVAYERALSTSSLVPDPADGEGENLLYVSMWAAELKGLGWEIFDVIPLSAETGSNEEGWAEYDGEFDTSA